MIYDINLLLPIHYLFANVLVILSKFSLFLVTSAKF